MKTRYQNYVGGEWVDSVEGETDDVRNPSNGTCIAIVPKGTTADVTRAVMAAGNALESWIDTTPRERSLMLLKIATILEDNLPELAQLEVINAGKLGRKAADELGFGVDVLRFFAGAARCMDGVPAGEYRAGFTSMVRREPVGVIAQITPWNYPLLMALWKLGPALAGGNVCIVKPSEHTPMSTLRFAELIDGVLPPGVLNVVTGEGDPVGAGLVAHAGVDMVSLTGDVTTGQAVARAAAETLKRVHLELGGKTPLIIFDDADVRLAKDAILYGAYANAGQMCTASSRVLASSDVYDDVLSELVPAVAALEVGDPASGEHVDVGPVITRRQQERVVGFVERARAESDVEVLVGGGRIDGPGFFVEPTVISGVRQADEIVQREVFGPVVTVQRFATDEEALTWANDVAYGLHASVWTNDLGRALTSARKLRFGTVWVNEVLGTPTEMPHGGFGRSGYGKDLSVYALEEHTEIKHVSLRGL